MSERDFIFWLKGFIAGKQSLDRVDIEFIDHKIDDVFKDKEDRAEISLSEIIRRASS